MNKIKKLLIAAAAVLALTALSVTAYAAAAYESPAEAVAALTGRTVENVTEERRETGNTYGAIAGEAGVLDEFKSAMLDVKKADLEEQVASGSITREQADEILARLEENMTECDGTGGAMGAKNHGAGFGAGAGGGRNGSLDGSRSQMRLKDGSCGVS